MLKQIIKTYKKSTNWTKILLFLSFLFIIVLLFKNVKSSEKVTEGFEQNDQFLFKTGNDVYDKFYAEIYDYLVYNNYKDDYEVGEIINKTTPTSSSKILDIGCGTGNQVVNFSSKGYEVLGIDISPSMINKAIEKYPNYNFKVADALNKDNFNSNAFTHITCLYFTIYYFQNKRQLLENIYRWLMPGGYFIVHLVDRKMFDPILPPGNPLLMVSPQRYAKERITTTKVKFDGFSYSAKFDLDENQDIAKFNEKFKMDDGSKSRKNEHILYMPEKEEIINEIQNVGFISYGIVDLINCQYEYQYLYIFTKPT
jgi:ubiquinone/menaquinone biosynthesis C-methylase UbiE